MTTRPRSTDDRGAALVLSIMVIALVGVLTTTILGVTVNNLGSTRRTQDSARALDAAEAGITQTVEHLRRSGTRGLPCDSTCQAGRGAPVTTGPQEVYGADDQTYETWVKPAPGVPSTVYEQAYILTSEGIAGSGKRVLQVTVTLSLADVGLPLGLFARSIQGGGTPKMDGLSIFSTGCVWKRSKIEFGAATDVAYGIPTAVHSSSIITDSQGNGRDGCPATDNQAIHKTTKCLPTTSPYQWDQDALGGTCDRLATAHPRYYGPQDLDADPAMDVDGTRIDDANALQELFGIREEPLTADHLDYLKAVAKSQVHNGNDGYWTTETYVPPEYDRYPDAVMYFEIEGDDTVNLSNLGSDWASASGCPDRSLLIIIENGNATMQGNADLVASVVLTSRENGEFNRGNGTADLTGTMFANSATITGTLEMRLDSCFLSNLSPSLYSATVSRYRELDSSS